MSDRRRLIASNRGKRVLQFPSSPESSDNEYLVYQREAPDSRESTLPKTLEKKQTSSPPTGKKPLVQHSDQKEYRTITERKPTSNMPDRERMDMDYNNGKTGGPTFSRKKGWFIERKWAYLLIVLVIGALLLVGLLSGLLGKSRESCTPSDAAGDEDFNGGQSSLTPEEALALRLLRGVKPLAYTIQLQPFLNGDLSVPGTMTLAIECLEATSNITLNVLNVNVTEGSVHLESMNGGNGSVPNVKSLQYDPDHQMVIIYLDGELTVNETYTVNMTYVGLINEVLAGLYKSSYQSGNETKYLAVTQFEATDARRVFPCFDEPAFKATFDISIIRESNMTAISNGPLIRTETREDGWLVDYFGTTPKMSTYLVAFVISDFAYLNDSSYRVWARKDVISSAQYTVSIGPGIIRYYDELFAINYPMKKTDNVAIPDFNAGAMENWGLITYRETSLLFDPQLSTAYEKQYICQTVAHELAHQWFGNLVTPLWWNDLWLNEGFASYMEYYASDIVEPGWKMMQLFVTDKQQSALSLDSLRSSHPISVQVNSPSEINDLFDGISYDKGASIIKMMHLFLGDTAFKEGLRTYLSTFAYGNAVSEDLWEHMYEAQNLTQISSPVNVSSIMNKWSKQTGYPLLTVTRDYTYQTVNLTQNIFLIDSTNITEEEMETVWDIPVTWGTSSADPSQWNTYPSLWLQNKTMTTDMITSSPTSWIIVNVQAAGFYRVNYDPTNWKMIIDQLLTDHNKIDVITRTQLIDDSFNLAKAGILPYTTALDMTKYLNAETDYLPFSTALGNIGIIGAMFCRSDVYGILKQHMLNLVTPNYMRMGWANMSQSSVQEQYLQVEAISVACGNDYPDCVQKGTSLFQAWKRNPMDKTTINPNLRKTVYCTGIAHGNYSDWEFVWNRYKTETVPSEKDKLRSALSCSREMWILSRLLHLSLDPSEDISPQDAPSVICSVATTDHGRELAFNFVQDQWKSLFEMFGELSFSLSNILQAISSRLNTRLEEDEFRAFKNQVFQASQVGTAKSGFYQALEKIGSNIQLMDRSYEEISSWFKTINNVSTVIEPAQNTSSNNASKVNYPGNSARLTSNNGTGTRNETQTEIRFNGTSNTSSENTRYNVETRTTFKPNIQSNRNNSTNGNSNNNRSINSFTNSNNESVNRDTNGSNNENLNRNSNNDENLNRNSNNDENINTNGNDENVNRNNNNDENVNRNNNNNENVNRNNNNNENVNRNNNNENVNGNININSTPSSQINRDTNGNFEGTNTNNNTEANRLTESDNRLTTINRMDTNNGR